MAQVWETAWLGSTKNLDTHVLGLRKKLGPAAITTLRGIGCRLELT
jgi:DNA-binding response OmpR family regulator